MRYLLAVVSALCLMFASLQSAAQEKIDLDLVTKLRSEAKERSRVMETLGVLTDEIGPRLTGSPSLIRAGEWTQSKLREWGLQNVHTESFAPFGRSWVLEHTSLRMIAPEKLDLIAIPKAWTPGTEGAKRAHVIAAKLSTEEDLAKWKGKLANAIVLIDEAQPNKPHLKPDANLYNDTQLEELTKINFDTQSDAPLTPRYDKAKAIKDFAFRKKLMQFIIEEKVLAVLNASRGEDGTIFVQGGGSYKTGEPTGPPNLVLMKETYNRLYRLVEKKKRVELELDVKVSFTDENPAAAISVIGDIVGSDKKDEFVMLGGHLDSWQSATGATDNGVGVAVSMEAVRMLKAVGFKPRRTIRIALWGGEEQGLLGSRAYVKQWVAARPDSTDPKEKELPSYLRKTMWPLTLKPQHSKISAYFNLDNGAGKIRGIFAENNAAVKPIFEAWLAPFHDIGATTVSLRNTGSTDHVSFDSVGVPGFQFIQDELDYLSRTHHSNLDVYDKVQRGDMIQASLIMAHFVAHAANRPELLPRKPLPQEPPKDDKPKDNTVQGNDEPKAEPKAEPKVEQKADHKADQKPDQK